MKKFLFAFILIPLLMSYQARCQGQRLLEIVDEKSNPTLGFEKNPFYSIIYEAVTTGRKGVKVDAYKDTSLKKGISAEEILKIGASEETFPVYPDPENNPEESYDTTVVTLFNPVKISTYLVITDPIETENGPGYQVRAIAPVIENWVANVKTSEQVIFWVKFEDIAEVLGKEIFLRPRQSGG